MRVKDIIRSLPAGDDWVAYLSLHKKDLWTIAEPSWAEREHGRLTCSTCWKVLPSVWPVPIEPVLIQLPKQEVYAGVWHGGARVIRNDLLSVLASYLPEHVLGRCFWKDGTVVSGYKSIYFRRWIQDRGDATADYFRCRMCGFVGCSCEGLYVLRRELDASSIFVDRIGILYFSASFTRAFPWKQFPELRPWCIPIRDEPLADDALDEIESTIQELASHFNGDVSAAFAAVEAEVSKLSAPMGRPTLRVEVQGIPILATGFSRDGRVTTVDCFRRA